MKELFIDHLIALRRVDLMVLAGLFDKSIKNAQEKFKELKTSDAFSQGFLPEIVYLNQLTKHLVALDATPYFEKYRIIDEEIIVRRLASYSESSAKVILGDSGRYQIDGKLKEFQNCSGEVLKLLRMKFYIIISERRNDLSKANSEIDEMLLRMGIRTVDADPVISGESPALEFDFDFKDAVELNFEDEELNELKESIGVLDNILLVPGLGYYEAKVPLMQQSRD